MNGTSGSRLSEWLERIGYTAQWISDAAQSMTEATAGMVPEPEHWDEIDGEEIADALGGLDDWDEDPDADAALSGSAAMLATGASAWLANRLLQPRKVNWPRAVLAGVVGTLLYDVGMLIDQRVTGRRFDTIGPLGAAISDDPEVQQWAGWVAHYAAGIGLSVFYARYVYGRVPLPGAVQGAAFGAADAALLQWGGLLPVLSQAAPHVRLPAGYAGLAHEPELGAQSLFRHLAYGVGVGMVYEDE